MKTNNTRIGTFTAVIALTAALGVANAATAKDVDDSLTQKVAYGDLNLDSAAGANTLYARIKGAARQVCVPLESIDTFHRAAWQSCYNHAVDTAVASVNKAQLTALRVEASRGPAG